MPSCMTFIDEKQSVNFIWCNQKREAVDNAYCIPENFSEKRAKKRKETNSMNECPEGK